MALRTPFYLDASPFLKALDQAQGAHAKFGAQARSEARALGVDFETVAGKVKKAGADQTEAIRSMIGAVKRLSSEAKAEIDKIEGNKRLGLIDEGQATREIAAVRARVSAFVSSTARDLGAVPPELRKEMVEALDVVDRGFDGAAKSAGGFRETVNIALGNLAANVLQDLGRRLGEAVVQLYTLSSAAGETASKYGVVFGESGAARQAVDAFIDANARLLGMTDTEARDILSTYGSIAQGFGFTQEAAAQFSTQMVSTAGDMSSFDNAPVEETLGAIKSALAGSWEPMERFGVVLRQADVEQRAMAMSGKTNAAALTLQEKATATLALIQEKQALKMGDLAKTQDSTANKGRRLQAEMRQQAETLALELAPAYAQLIDFGLELLSGNEAQVASFAALVGNGVMAAVSAFIALVDALVTTGNAVWTLADGALDLTASIFGAKDGAAMAAAVFGFLYDNLSVLLPTVIAYGVALKAEAIVTAVATAAQNGWTAAKLAGANALRILRLLILTNPIGLIVTALILAGSLAWKFRASILEAAAAILRFASESAPVLTILSALTGGLVNVGAGLAAAATRLEAMAAAARRSQAAEEAAGRAQEATAAQTAAAAAATTTATAATTAGTAATGRATGATREHTAAVRDQMTAVQGLAAARALLARTNPTQGISLERVGTIRSAVGRAEETATTDAARQDAQRLGAELDALEDRMNAVGEATANAAAATAAFAAARAQLARTNPTDGLSAERLDELQQGVQRGGETATTDAAREEARQLTVALARLETQMGATGEAATEMAAQTTRLLEDARDATEDYAVRSVSSLEQRARALERQALLDRENAAALREQAAALRDLERQQRVDGAKERMLAIAEQLREVTARETSEYADQIEELRVLAMTYPQLRAELMPLIDAYTRLEAAKTPEGQRQAAEAAATSALAAAHSGLALSLNSVDAAQGLLQDAFNAASTEEERREIQALMTQLDALRNKLGDVSADAVDLGPALADGITSMVETFAEGLGQMMAGTGNMETVALSLLGVLADLAVQVGQLLIGFAVSALALRAMMSNPWLTLAAGVALVALGSFAKSAIANAMEGATGGSGRDEGPAHAGYAKGGHVKEGAQLVWVNEGEGRYAGQEYVMHAPGTARWIDTLELMRDEAPAGVIAKSAARVAGSIPGFAEGGLVGGGATRSAVVAAGDRDRDRAKTADGLDGLGRGLDGLGSSLRGLKATTRVNRRDLLIVIEAAVEDDVALRGSSPLRG